LGDTVGKWGTKKKNESLCQRGGMSGRGEEEVKACK